MNDEDKLDISFKDLDKKELDAFYHTATSWQIMTSYQVAEKLLGSDANFEDKKNYKWNLWKTSFLFRRILQFIFSKRWLEL